MSRHSYLQCFHSLFLHAYVCNRKKSEDFVIIIILIIIFSSKLASLFGMEKSATDNISSLTYVAPKQPKKLQADAFEGQKVEGGESTSATKFSLICAKAVTAYRL